MDNLPQKDTTKDMKNLNQNNKAFTMIEMVFAIIVIGVLTAVALPRLQRDTKQQVADSILSDIRYTQHLALIDDKHNINNNSWQRSFWRIGFNSCGGGSGLYEYIGSDMDYGGGISNNEAAIDPVNGKRMNWSTFTNCSNGGDAQTSDRIFLTNKYGITNISWGGSCSRARYVGFDNMGRPHQGFTLSGSANYISRLNTACFIKFKLSGGDTFSISIQPETGYAQIVGQDQS